MLAAGPVHTVCVTLVTGASAAAREAALAAALQPIATTPTPTAAALAAASHGAIALILEGFPSGLSQHAALDPQQNPALAQAARIAPGCLCCVGNLTLKVTLNRILRRAPQRLQCIYISLASATHIEQLRVFLSLPPYDRLLTLTDDLDADDCR